MYFRMGGGDEPNGEGTEINFGAGMPFLAAAQTVSLLRGTLSISPHEA
jgi:hypothetical protein